MFRFRAAEEGYFIGNRIFIKNRRVTAHCKDLWTVPGKADAPNEIRAFAIRSDSKDHYMRGCKSRTPKSNRIQESWQENVLGQDRGDLKIKKV